MADDPTNDLSLPSHDAGLAFRAEMWTTNFVFGYWKHITTALVLGLVGVLVYGLWRNEYQADQRDASAEIHKLFVKVPTEARPGEETDDELATIRSVADGLSAVGAETSGAARTEAYLKAAELYRRTGDVDLQRTAFEAALDSARGALAYSARSGIANLDLEAGNTDAAIAAYRELMDTLEPYLAQQAALDLGAAYEFLDRPADARGLYTEFLGRWPNSAHLSEVERRMAALEGGS